MYVKYALFHPYVIFSVFNKYCIGTVIHWAGIWINIGNKERSSTYNRPTIDK